MSENIKGGILIIDKPAGFTSQDAVNKIRRFYNTKQVGHTGTLDPMATGVLVVLVGRAVKASEYLMSEKKTYIAGIKLGITTDTEDTSGKILSVSDNIPTKDEFINALSDFEGEIMQTPPMYSAIKKDGKKLVDLARKGIEVEREERKIVIESLECLSGEKDEYIIKVTCSKGTYIRTLCKDIGDRLSCGGAMSSLRRIKNGGFGIEKAKTLEEIENTKPEEREKLFIPIENAFSEYEKVILPPFYERLCKNGAEIYLDRIGYDFGEGKMIRIFSEEGFFAVGKVGIFKEGKALKALKFLV